MRAPLALALLLAASPAAAESSQEGGGGALGRTNAGIGEAVSGGSSSSGGSSGGGGGGGGGSSSGGSSWHGSGNDAGYYSNCTDIGTTLPQCGGGLYVQNGRSTVSVLPEEQEAIEDYYTGDRARFSGYVGIQKVHDSDGSGTVELSVTDYRFRVSGALSHYVEDQGGGGRTTLTLPSLMAGFRLTGRGNTQLYVDGGVSVAVSRGAPAMDTSITAPTVGAQVVQYVSHDLAVFGDARAMFFGDGVQAVAGKVGIKLNWAQLSVRVLDFNVGPALWGPELGLAF